MHAADPETVYRFYALPAASAHESWLTFIPHELLSLSRRSPLATRVLSHVLMQKASLLMPSSFDLALEHQWVLRDADRLVSAALRLGAIAVAPHIAASIERDRVKRLREVLGEDLYREILASAQTAIVNLPHTSPGAWTSATHLRSFLERVGMALMLETLPDDDALRRRVAVKFPLAYAEVRAVVLTSIDVKAVTSLLQTLLSGD